MDILVHAANLFILWSFSVRDILWLRVLSILAGFCFIPYFYMQPEPLWAPIGWNMLFMLVNAVQIWRLLLERRPVHLTADEQTLYDLVFGSLTPREASKLMRAGEWREHPGETTLCRAGEEMDWLAVLCDGRARVMSASERLAELAPGTFVGEIGYLTNAPSSADVVAEEPVRFLVWNRDTLDAFLERHPDVRAALQRILGLDVASKLQAVAS